MPLSRKICLLISFYVSINLLYSQHVGIGTLTPEASAILDISSTTKGVLLPRLTTEQRELIMSPVEGLIIFNTTTSRFNMYTHSSWEELNIIPKGTIVLSHKFRDSTLLNEGFAYNGFFSQNFKSQIFGDTIIPAYHWYLGNRSDYLMENAPGESGICGFTGQNLVYFTFDSVYHFNPVEDAWTSFPIPITYHNYTPYFIRSGTITWTGTEFLLWGGKKCDSPIQSGCLNYSITNFGLRYNPASHSWNEISTLNAPGPRENHKAVWSGNEMIIWGGNDVSNPIQFMNTGGKYNPTTNSWTTLPTPNLSPRINFSMDVVESNTVMIWGGNKSIPVSRTIDNPCNPGNSYQLEFDSIVNYNDGQLLLTNSNTWLSVESQNAPMPRYGHSATIAPPYGYFISGGIHTIYNGVYCGLCSPGLPGFPPYPCVKVQTIDSTLNTANSYDVSTNTWFDNISPVPRPFHHADAIWDTEQYISYFFSDTILSLEVSTGEWTTNAYPPNGEFIYNNDHIRKIVWPYYVSSTAGFPDLIALIPNSNQTTRQKVYNYRTVPTTINELKNTIEKTGYKFYVYVKE